MMVRIGEAHREMAERTEARILPPIARHIMKRSPPCAGRQPAADRPDCGMAAKESRRGKCDSLRKSVSTFRTHCRKEQHHLAGELRQVAKVWAKMHHHAL